MARETDGLDFLGVDDVGAYARAAVRQPVQQPQPTMRARVQQTRMQAPVMQTRSLDMHAMDFTPIRDRVLAYVPVQHDLVLAPATIAPEPAPMAAPSGGGASGGGGSGGGGGADDGGEEGDAGGEEGGDPTDALVDPAYLAEDEAVAEGEEGDAEEDAEVGGGGHGGHGGHHHGGGHHHHHHGGGFRGYYGPWYDDGLDLLDAVDEETLAEELAEKVARKLAAKTAIGAAVRVEDLITRFDTLPPTNRTVWSLWVEHSHGLDLASRVTQDAQNIIRKAILPTNEFEFHDDVLAFGKRAQALSDKVTAQPLNDEKSPIWSLVKAYFVDGAKFANLLEEVESESVKWEDVKATARETAKGVETAAKTTAWLIGGTIGAAALAAIGWIVNGAVKGKAVL